MAISSLLSSTPLFLSHPPPLLSSSTLHASSALQTTRHRLIACASSPESPSPSPTPAPAPTPTPTPASSPPPLPKKPVLTMKKGEIVRVDKEKYLNSVEYLAVGHPVYYTGIDYIYEDRGEILDVRMFETGEYALISWAGVPTSPAWLPAYMLIKSTKLSYKRT